MLSEIWHWKSWKNNFQYFPHKKMYKKTNLILWQTTIISWINSFPQY